jgi:hypothetical protein
MALVPEAYNALPDIEDRPHLKAFYDYYAGIQVGE